MKSNFIELISRNLAPVPRAEGDHIPYFFALTGEKNL
jgi:hypothetical protein